MLRGYKIKFLYGNINNGKDGCMKLIVHVKSIRIFYDVV